MEDLVKKALSEAIQQVPALCVLSGVVWVFVKVIFRFIKHIEDRGQVMQELHREHIDAREQYRKALEDNTQTMLANTHALNTLITIVERLKPNNIRHQ